MAKIYLLPGGQVVDCANDEAVLAALEAAGYPVPSDCRAGACGTCKVKVTSGEIRMTLYLPIALLDEEHVAGYRLTCVGYPAADSLRIDYGEAMARAGRLPVALFAPRQQVELVVVDKIPRTPEIVELRLRPVGSRLRYWPGQYVELNGPGGARRSYSISNAPRRDGELSLYVSRTKGGRVSSWIHDDLRVGGRVSISGPYGTFVGDPGKTGPVLCLAGGSGLAPILALAEAALSRGYSGPVTLLFSARTEDHVFARGLLAHWEARYPGFRFLTTLTDGAPGGAGLRGRIPDVLHAVTPDLTGFEVFIAGSPDFVEACAGAVRRLGAGEERIHAERYFPQDRDDSVGE
jgi:CDP-4-dehydro-6-deoxyglucose reductase